jgi:hypothetical protein
VITLVNERLQKPEGTNVGEKKSMKEKERKGIVDAKSYGNYQSYLL